MRDRDVIDAKFRVVEPPKPKPDAAERGAEWIALVVVLILARLAWTPLAHWVGVVFFGHDALH